MASSLVLAWCCRCIWDLSGPEWSTWCSSTVHYRLHWQIRDLTNRKKIIKTGQKEFSSTLPYYFKQSRNCHKFKYHKVTFNIIWRSLQSRLCEVSLVCWTNIWCNNLLLNGACTPVSNNVSCFCWHRKNTGTQDMKAAVFDKGAEMQLTGYSWWAGGGWWGSVKHHVWISAVPRSVARGQNHVPRSCQCYEGCQNLTPEHRKCFGLLFSILQTSQVLSIWGWILNQHIHAKTDLTFKLFFFSFKAFTGDFRCYLYQRHK